nr:class I SAM-dependent methyltransferase [Actinomycetota bacterium]
MNDLRPSPDPGSFRDPLSRVYITDDEVYRGLSAEGLAAFESVQASSFFPALLAEGLVVPTERAADPVPLVGGTWAGALRHERVPVISYPFEWTFEMLRDAALLQLEVTRRALTEGFITKDATSFNVQFDGARPVFIDVGSFERPPPGEPWPGYRQFCQLFLNPLVVQAVAGIPFQPWLRGSLDGISPSQVAPLIRGSRRLDRRLMVHVGLHARAESRYADTDAERDVRDDLRQAGFGPKVIAAQLDSLERTVRSLRSGEEASTWSDYSDRAHYDDADLASKEATVAEAVSGSGAQLVLDLGANDGRFSQLAVDSGAARAVAVDSDHLVVDRLYRRLRDTGEGRILPLVLDLTDPSPGLGWRSQERRSFTERVRPDLVLCLAVVHHLALTNNVPFDLIVELLADFDAPVVVELPLRDDPMAARLLARKRKGLCDQYDAPQWEGALGRRFTIEERTVLPSGRRVLY